MTPEQIAAALAEPFPVEAVSWKAQTASGNRCLAVAYIDARDVMDRLDAVVGVAGWQDEYTALPGGNVYCRLSLRIGGDWIPKADVGGESDQKDDGDRCKAAFSDALKRAAVKFGVGRYLYSLPKQWVEYDPQKRQIVGKCSLPAWALPKAAPAAAKPPQQPANGTPAAPPPKAKPPQSGKELLEKIKAHEATLVAKGLCDKGDLIATLKHHGEATGLGDRIEDWRCPTPGYQIAQTLVAEFEAAAQKLQQAQAQLQEG